MSEGQQDRRRELAVTDDPRAARTRDRIVGALGELLSEGAAVSVAAVCARAEVGRSTFYTHFATVGDVVVFVVDAMFEELATLDLVRRQDSRAPRGLITRIGAQELLAALGARRGYFLYAVSAPAAERVRERLVQEMSRTLRVTIRAVRPVVEEGFLVSAGDFIAGGVLGLLLGWLEDPRGRTEQDVSDIVVDLLPPLLTGAGER